MNILLILTDPPIPFGNAAARWFSILLAELPKRGHRLTVMVSCDEKGELESREYWNDSDISIQYFRRANRTGLSRWNSLLMPYSYIFSDEMLNALKVAERQNFDLVHAEHLWGGYATRHLKTPSFINLHYLFEHDWKDSKPQNWKEWLIRATTQRAERILVRRQTHLTALTPEILNSAAARNSKAVKAVIPITVDCNLYPYQEPEHSKPTLGLIGSFNWRPTMMAALRLLRLWPEIKNRVPDCQLQFVGRKAVSQLSPHVDDCQIQLIEDVPDIIPYFHGLDVLAYAPDHGSGIKVKILEAFALGPAVVTNHSGAEGLPIQDSLHVQLAETDEEFIDACCTLLTDQNTRLKQSQTARSWLETEWAPARIVDTLEQFYARISIKNS